MNVSVVIPALNEEATIAGVVDAALACDPHEVLVIDSDSTDNTVQEAGAATVVNWRDVLDVPVVPGKGEALWRGVHAASGDVVVFLDADLHDPHQGMVSRLAAPFVDPGIQLVKASYQRLIDDAPGGGRVTELTAKPLLRQLFPELADIDQPLGGEYAIRRSTALELPFVCGFGVEAGLLIDVYRRFGRASISSVELRPRRHRNKPLQELGPMADVVAATILQRAGILASSFPGERRV